MNPRDFIRASQFLVRTGFHPGARGYILLLSHMRSRSSVLSHVIGSNPDVVGYFENHVKLRNSLDLLSLTEKVATLTKKSPRGKWVYDKVLHSNLTVTSEILNRPDVLPIFLVREPVESISSIARQLADKGWHERKATKYYQKRVHELVELATACDRKLILDSNDLVSDTKRILDKLSRFVGVETPFRSRYEKGALTGVRKFGDSSEDIHRGEIVQTSEVIDSGASSTSNAGPEATAAYQSYCQLRSSTT
ncbi:MAG: hypothetical protein KDN19_06440 [Verrucomicrobiae bacterium]|nr:hypothetical protein [Verrucomicrobiae bacterium]